MEKYDPRIDAYIEKSEEFTKPILNHLRTLVHQACPEVTETIKWGFPIFEYKGQLCNMAAFKQHCGFGFWKSSMLPDPHQILLKNEGAGSIGKLTSLSDLPSDAILIEYVQNAAKLNEAGIKKPVIKPSAVKTEIPVPDYFNEALKENPSALEHFEKFSYSHRKEYLQWITEAKSEDTRQKRMATAIEWISEGKGRNWKYEKK
jgi:uncharacterized protein YdeI (YjbR/CyaY-like superfamily)